MFVFSIVSFLFFSEYQFVVDRIYNKHIKLHMHFIRKISHDQVIEVLFFPTEYQVANIFTKSLTEVKFSNLRSMLGFQEVVIKGG